LSTAIDIADRDGIDAVTLRRLAETLDVHPTSIYNHLANKDAILDGVIERLLIEAELPAVVSDWANWIREFAAAMRRTASAHPRAFGVFLVRSGTGPTALRHIEGALDAFRRAGCSVEESARAVHGVSLAVVGLALEEGMLASAIDAPALSRVDLDAHPRIAEVERAGISEAATGPTWDLVVEALVSGYAALLRLAPAR
jgi:AcrR family transcriptional regulator